jgi:hypothetical protein
VLKLWLDGKTIRDLKLIAKALNLYRYGAMNSQDLIEAIVSLVDPETTIKSNPN